MEKLGGIPNEIENIVSQAKTTEIKIGHITGHFLSTAQAKALDDCIGRLKDLNDSLLQNDTPEGSITTIGPVHEESAVRARRIQVHSEIQAKQLEIATSNKSDRSRLNLEFGALISERTKLDKLIKASDTQQQ